MKIKFENHSISGIFREYAGFILNIPGHALGAKAVVANVPDELATDVRKYLKDNHPAIVVTVEGEEDFEAAAAKEAAEKAEAERLAAESEAAQKAAEEAEALAAKEKAEAEQAAKEAAEKAEAAKAKKGGR